MICGGICQGQSQGTNTGILVLLWSRGQLYKIKWYEMTVLPRKGPGVCLCPQKPLSPLLIFPLSIGRLSSGYLEDKKKAQFKKIMNKKKRQEP
jgi:hypothetical protein